MMTKFMTSMIDDQIYNECDNQIYDDFLSQIHNMYDNQYL